MIREHITEEELRELECLATLRPTTKTGSTAFYEMMKPYLDGSEEGETLPVPTHNYELLKDHRQKQYEQKRIVYEAARQNNGFQDSTEDNTQFRLLWLKDELKVVKRWLSKTESGKRKKGRKEEDIKSDTAEQHKYKNYIRDQIKAAKEKLEYLRSQSARPAPDTLNPPAIGEHVKLSHSQIAILYHIAGWQITLNNANEIAGKYGLTSGQKLEATYKDLTSELTRTGKSKYRVGDYNKIAKSVPNEHKAKYDKELKAAIANNKK